MNMHNASNFFIVLTQPTLHVIKAASSECQEAIRKLEIPINGPEGQPCNDNDIAQTALAETILIAPIPLGTVA